MGRPWWIEHMQIWFFCFSFFLFFQNDTKFKQTTNLELEWFLLRYWDIGTVCFPSFWLFPTSVAWKEASVIAGNSIKWHPNLTEISPGRATQESFIREAGTDYLTGSLHPKVQTLTLLYSIFDKKVHPLRIPSIDKLYPSHIPSQPLTFETLVNALSFKFE